MNPVTNDAPGRWFATNLAATEDDMESVWTQTVQSHELQLLHSRLLGFVVPSTIGFLIWFFVYVCLCAWAPIAMSTKVSGDLTVGICLAIGQFCSTFLLTAAYVRFAGRQLDPLARQIRDRLEAADS